MYDGNDELTGGIGGFAGRDELAAPSQPDGG